MYESHELTLSGDAGRLPSFKEGGRITLGDIAAAVGGRGFRILFVMLSLTGAIPVSVTVSKLLRFYDIIAAGKLYVSEPVCLKDVPWLRAVRVHPETGGPPVSGKETKNGQKMPSLAV